MPLPFILAGVAVGLGLTNVGVKKGYDGYQDKSEAKDILDNAKRDYEKAVSDLEADDKRVQDKLEELGVLQLDTGKDFNEFQTIAEDLLDKINNASKADIQVNVPKYQVKRIEKVSVDLASASIGAASIATLSGYSSVLTVTSGLGMGAALLSGVVAAPVLVAAAWIFASHAEEALSEAKEFRMKVRDFQTQAEVSRGYLQDTCLYVSKITLCLNRIRIIFNSYLEDLKIVEMAMRRGHSDILDKEDDIVRMVENGYAVAAILTDIITTPLFKVKEEDGTPVVDEDGIPVFEHNEDGTKILNKTKIRKVVEVSKRNAEQFRE